jgi:hypothetical protein
MVAMLKGTNGMNGIKDLERSALDAHRNGQGWSEFWQQHADAIRKAEPWNRQRLRRLVDRLLALVTSGDCAGMIAVGDTDAEPWEVDDAQAPGARKRYRNSGTMLVVRGAA